jgi:hypothetical protein
MKLDLICNGGSDVKIICKKHGSFDHVLDPNQDPNKGSICPICDLTSKFIEKAKRVHGLRYNYSKVNYKNNQKRLVIICEEHGEFRQIPNNHLSGSGCPNCPHRRKTINKFIEEAIEVHGPRYDYSKTMYTHSKNKVTIICREHGEFEQVASNHLLGSGCLKCACKKRKRIHAWPQKEMSYIEKAITVHGQDPTDPTRSKYDYSKTIYTDSREKVIVICREHGEFEQRANNHLSGAGCPVCRYKRQKTSVN